MSSGQPYRIEFKPAASRAWAKLSKGVQARIEPRIADLAENPRPPGSTKLVGEEGFYRIRVGDYRVIYQIEDDILLILVVEVGHRRDVYPGI